MYNPYDPYHRNSFWDGFGWEAGKFAFACIVCGVNRLLDRVEFKCECKKEDKQEKNENMEEAD